MSKRFHYVTILFLCLPLVFIGLVQWGAIPKHYLYGGGGIGRSLQQLQHMRSQNSYIKLEAQPNRIEFNPWQVSSTPQRTGSANLPFNPFARSDSYSKKNAPKTAGNSGLEAGALVAGLFALVFLSLSFSTPSWVSLPVACFTAAATALGGIDSPGSGETNREPMFLLPLVSSLSVYSLTHNPGYTIFVALVFGFGIAIRKMGGNRQALGIDRTWWPTQGEYAAPVAKSPWQLPWKPGSSSAVGPPKPLRTLSRDPEARRGPGWIAALDANAPRRVG